MGKSKNVKKARRSEIYKLALHNEKKFSPGIIRLLILLFVFVPKGTYRPDYALTNGRKGEYAACWADFGLCYFNPLSWVCIVLTFIGCILGGIWVFITESRRDIFGNQSVYIKNHNLSRILDEDNKVGS